MHAALNYLHKSIFVLAVFAVSLCAAQTSADYVGMYRRGSVDSAEQLALLDDNTYCYAVTAGSLDLLSGGRWAVLPGKDAGVELREVKPNKPVFPASAKSVSEQSGQVVFDFHGHSLSRARTAVFAVSSDAEFPKEMRPLFHPDHNGWSSSYKLPAMDAGMARYFYIGYVQSDRRSGDSKLQVYQYKLDGFNAVRIGFDSTYAEPLIQFSLQWKQGDKAPVAERALYGGGGERPFGSKKPLTEKVLSSARSNCVEPAFSTASVYAQPRRDGSSLLEPVKAMVLDAKASQGKPWVELGTGN